MSIVVDVHAHVLFPEVMGLAGPAGPEMGDDKDGIPFFRSGQYVLSNVKFADSPFSDLAQRVSGMDRFGIDHQIISPNPLTYFYAQPVELGERFARAHNDASIAAVHAYPTRISALAQLPMQSPEAAVRELERAVKAGLCGAQIGSDFNGITLDDSKFEPVWAAFERLDVPVIVHPGTAGAERSANQREALRDYDMDIVIGFAADETMAAHTLIFGGVLDRHPKLRVIIPHAGGTAPWLKGRMRTAMERRPWARGRYTRSFDELWQQLSFDCLVGTDEAMRFLVDTEGAQRVMCGSNFAGWDQESGVVARVKGLGLDPARERAVLGQSAIDYFKLPLGAAAAAQ
jgi:aminocarboxymuconate-semialdehyde decarboxylase